jgi:Aspartyl protease
MVVGALVAGPVVGAVLDIPFDFSHAAIGVDVTVHGTPLFVLLDTGVDPSVIATARAASLGLRVERTSGGEASGYGVQVGNCLSYDYRSTGDPRTMDLLRKLSCRVASASTKGGFIL